MVNENRGLEGEEENLDPCENWNRKYATKEIQILLYKHFEHRFI